MVGAGEPLRLLTAALLVSGHVLVEDVPGVGKTLLAKSFARSLGLTRLQALRFVIVPQAVRRVIPPLLNDFIGLQKDTALVALIGPVEAFRQSQIEVASNFDYTPYFATALLFVLMTVPLARFTDWLVARQQRRTR